MPISSKIQSLDKSCIYPLVDYIRCYYASSIWGQRISDIFSIKIVSYFRNYWRGRDMKHNHLEHMIIRVSLRLRLLACCMITPHDENLFLYYSKVCQKIFCLKLRDVLVKLGKISTERNRNEIGNLHCPSNLCFDPWIYIFYQEFLSQTLMNHKTPGE